MGLTGRYPRSKKSNPPRWAQLVWVQDKRENLVRAPAQPDQSGRIRGRNDDSAGNETSAADNGNGGTDNKNRATDNKTTEVENVNGIDLKCGDALEELKTLPDGSVDLVLTDPPYNIGVQETRAGSKAMAAWDKIENYTDWCIDWLNECSRVLKPNGVLYFWHNDMAQNRGAAARDSGENRPCACELLHLGQGRHLPSEELEAARPGRNHSPALMV